MKSSKETGGRDQAPVAKSEPDADKNLRQAPQGPREVGGPKGLEPTRYGDWEKGGRCIDF